MRTGVERTLKEVVKPSNDVNETAQISEEPINGRSAPGLEIEVAQRHFTDAFVNFFSTLIVDLGFGGRFQEET
jgi:hypothetical protein